MLKGKMPGNTSGGATLTLKYCSEKLRSVGLHVGLVIATVLYVCLGAFVFQLIEQPNEMRQRASMRSQLNQEKNELLAKLSTLERWEDGGDQLLDEYMADMFELFTQPYSVHLFASANASADRTWTWSTSILFASTTLIPVGYGLIAPATAFGRFLLVVYGIVGIPLALITIADIAKFTNALLKKLCIKFSANSALFLALTMVYPLIGGLIFWHFAGLSILDGIYFSLISIFTIGYGDTMPVVPVVHLIFFIVLGVILVTMSIEAVAAETINQIHYMGRQVGKARAIAGKIAQMAHRMRGKTPFNGFQLQRSSISHLFFPPSYLRPRTDTQTRRSEIAFDPSGTDFDFVDKLELPSMVKSTSDARIEAIQMA